MATRSQINEATNKIYIGDITDLTVTMVNRVRNQIDKVMPLAAVPYYSDVDTLTNRISCYVKSRHAMVVINGISNQVMTTITVGSGYFPASGFGQKPHLCLQFW